MQRMLDFVRNRKYKKIKSPIDHLPLLLTKIEPIDKRKDEMQKVYKDKYKKK